MRESVDPENASDRSRHDRAPNLLLIGAPRCASTSLAFALEKHADIFLCKPKEPHFLAMHGRPRPLTGVGSEILSDGHQLRPEQWSGLFRHRTETYLMDASVTTISYPETSIPNIMRYCDRETKLLVILRNPVERTFSSYMYCVSKGWPAGTFEECLSSEGGRIEGDWQHLWLLRHLSRYELRLQPFLDAFGRENIHVAITEEFASDADAVLSGIFRFLGLPDARVDSSVRFNRSGVPHSLLGVASSFIRQRPSLLKGFKRFSTRSFRESAKNRSLLQTTMDEGTRRQLAHEFEGTRCWVEELIGRKLASWD